MSRIKTHEQAMRNLAYFATNYPPDFINSVYTDDSQITEHLTQKFRTSHSNHGAHLGFWKFFQELSPDNQTKLCEWINKNSIHISLPKEKTGFWEINESAGGYDSNNYAYGTESEIKDHWGQEGKFLGETINDACKTILEGWGDYFEDETLEENIAYAKEEGYYKGLEAAQQNGVKGYEYDSGT